MEEGVVHDEAGGGGGDDIGSPASSSSLRRRRGRAANDMQDDEIIDDVLSTSVDTFLTPLSAADPSPTVSSGLSSIDDPAPVSKTGGKKKAASAPEPPQNAPEKLICSICGKEYSKKSKRHYVNHIFLHHIGDANKQRLTDEDVEPFIDDYLLDILKEISEEPRIPAEKLHFVEEIMKSQGSSHWTRFLNAISSEIVKAITKRVKVLPSNQYEEILQLINCRLNDQVFFGNLQTLCQLCVSDQTKSKYVGVVVFRITFRLSEKIQLLVMKEMRKPSDQTVADVQDIVANIASLDSSPEEKVAFEAHMSKLVRNYYIKICKLGGPVWSVRAMCLRKEFVTSEAEEFVSHNSMMNAVMWLDNTLKLSEAASNFFFKVEGEIKKVFKETSTLSKDEVLQRISSWSQPRLLNDWCCLTLGYFGEQDALTFMRDILSIVINLSIRLEGKRMFALEQRSKRLPKFSLRGALKRN